MPIPARSYSHVRDVLNAALAGSFQARLRSLGYRRSAHTWRLREAGRVRIINVQSSWTNSRALGTFTVNLGIYDHALQTALIPRWGPLRANPCENHCAISTRIGRLMDIRPRVDHWWQVDLSTDPMALSHELMHVLNSVALPWLEKACDYRFAKLHSEFGRTPAIKEAIENVLKSVARPRAASSPRSGRR